MNLLLLSGESIRNRDWILEVETQLKPFFDKTFVHQYRHWQLDQPNIDLDFELEQIKQKSSIFGEYMIFAKSIGTVLSVKAIKNGTLTPKSLVFCGVPLGFIDPHYKDFKDDLFAAGLETAIVHNTSDKVGSFLELKEYLEPLPDNIELIESDGQGHDYVDYELIKKLVSKQSKSDG